MDYKEFLKILQSLNLEVAEPQYIQKNLVSMIEKIPVFCKILHPNYKIIRGRLGCGFSSVSELSYKPQEYNRTYQRASTPNKTMFYGAIFPEQKEDKSCIPRVTIFNELAHYSDNLKNFERGEEKITFGVWRVLEEIELIPLIYSKKDYGFLSEGFIKYKIDFERKLEKHTSEEKEKEKIKDIHNFLAKEFSKEEINNHNDYKISAILSEMISRDFDGMLYPSVRSAGAGLNVAIKPESVNQKMEFIEGIESIIYKNGTDYLISEDQNITSNAEGELIYTPLEIDQDFYRKKIGLI